MRILIVKMSSLGDVVHMLPAITDAAAHLPNLTVDWVVEEGFADIPALHPAVSDGIPIALRRWRRSLFSRLTREEISACRKRLKAQRYDLVLDTQGLLKSALIATRARGLRHGQDCNSAREPLASLFYHSRHAVARGQHAVTRNRQLAALALGYGMPDTPPDYGVRANSGQLPSGLPQHYVVGLHGTSRNSKLWPIERWIALGRTVAAGDWALLLPWGNDVELERARSIAASVPQAMVLPRLRLAELAVVLANAVAAVGVDTGLIHLAAALDIPTVAIYTDTDPVLTGVLGRDPRRFRNLGGVAQMPASEDVAAALNQVKDPFYSQPGRGMDLLKWTLKPSDCRR